MQLLEYFHDRNNNISNYHQRKYNIPNSNRVLIYGSPASGKSYLALDYIMSINSKKSLYIDFRDPKFHFKDIIEEDIEGFIEANGIEILILDHYKHNYFQRVPNSKKLVIISDYFYDYGDEFQNLEVSLLDYEEFFSFQKRGTETQVFNQFLRQGTLPQVAIDTKPKEQLFYLFIESHFDKSEQKLLGILAHFNTSTVTTHQLYTYAKERYKISKDLIYRQIKRLKERAVIRFIPDAINANTKKLIFFDFALAKYLTLTQRFPKQFDTMVALSLIKHKVEFQAFGIVGYLTNSGQLIIPAPFESEESSWKKAHSRFITYKIAEVKKVYIVTVTAQYRFEIENIEFEALPFYEWVVINDES